MQEPSLTFFSRNPSRILLSAHENRMCSRCPSRFCFLAAFAHRKRIRVDRIRKKKKKKRKEKKRAANYDRIARQFTRKFDDRRPLRAAHFRPAYLSCVQQQREIYEQWRATTAARCLFILASSRRRIVQYLQLRIYVRAIFRPSETRYNALI